MRRLKSRLNYCECLMMKGVYTKRIAIDIMGIGRVVSEEESKLSSRGGTLMITTTKIKFIREGQKRKIKSKVIKSQYQLHLFLIPAFLFFFIIHYIPMYGVQIAFRDYVEVKGILGSEWIGFSNFTRFFSSYQFWRLIKNTLGLSFYSLLAEFPIPIILALLLNQVGNKRYKKLVQTVTYAPHFISIVVMIGMVQLFLSPSSGIVNSIIKMVGGQTISFLGEASYFKHIYVFTGVWQHAGWGAILYLATLASVSPELYEAARVDGASKWHLIRHIDLPSILPTAIIMLILRVGRLMNIGMQKALLLQNPLNIRGSEIIPTYVYKMGILKNQYSYSATIGLFNSLINIILLFSVNKLAKKNIRDKFMVRRRGYEITY